MQLGGTSINPAERLWKFGNPEKADSRRAEFNKKMKALEHFLGPANVGSYDINRPFCVSIWVTARHSRNRRAARRHALDTIGI
jgi:hypothetical protein